MNRNEWGWIDVFCPNEGERGCPSLAALCKSPGAELPECLPHFLNNLCCVACVVDFNCGLQHHDFLNSRALKVPHWSRCEPLKRNLNTRGMLISGWYCKPNQCTKALYSRLQWKVAEFHLTLNKAIWSKGCIWWKPTPLFPVVLEPQCEWHHVRPCVHACVCPSVTIVPWLSVIVCSVHTSHCCQPPTSAWTSSLYSSTVASGAGQDIQAID